uniref:Uncharacterized protein n=1 Tax=Chelydra serpentina TaxID=8475 RepID=A0A8C3S3Q5_CHESE
PLSLCIAIVTYSLNGDYFREDFPPGPKPLPIIGNLHIMDLKRPYRTMLELSKKYGPVFSIQMGCQKMVVLSGYEMVKEALVNQADAFAERPKIPVFEDTSKGYGVIFSHGNNWKVMRRFTLATLRDFGMGKRAIEDQIVEEYGFLMKDIESREGSFEDLGTNIQFVFFLFSIIQYYFLLGFLSFL